MTVNAMGVYADSSPDALDGSKVETIVKLLTRILGSAIGVVSVSLRNESFGNGALNDEVYGSNCGRCPVFIHDLLYSP
jgi:hypothetical protein